MSEKLDISIQLDKGSGPYFAGQPISGKVVVQTRKTIKCKELEISLEKTIEGPHLSSQILDGTKVTHPVTWRAGEGHEYPFTFTLPSGPYSFTGSLLRCRWMIYAKASLSILKTIEIREAFQLEPGDQAKLNLSFIEEQPWMDRDDTKTQQNQGRFHEHSTRNANIFKYRWMIFAALFLITLALNPKNDANLYVLLILTIWLPALRFYQKSIMPEATKQRTGRLEWEVVPLVCPGDIMPIHLTFRPNTSLTLKNAAITVVAEEVTVFKNYKRNRKGNYQRQYFKMICETYQPKSGKFRTFLKEEEASFHWDIPIHEQSPYTLISAWNMVQWRVELLLEFENMPDINESKVISMVPISARKSAAQGDIE